MNEYSVVYHHLVAVTATELGSSFPAPAGRTVRILEAGCGSGRLLGLLATRLPSLFPDIDFQFYGFDVAESSVQKNSFMKECLERLDVIAPSFKWRERLTTISESGEWPYEDGYFDFVLTNQVMEHVTDLGHFLQQVSRVLLVNGKSINVFPLRPCWMELHVKLPFAHWLSPGSFMHAYIKGLSALGFGTWRRYKRQPNAVSLDQFCEMNRDFIAYETNYVNEMEIERLCKPARLRPHYDYTYLLYINKLRSMIGLPLKYGFRKKRSWSAMLGFHILKRVSGVTLTLERKNTYENLGFHTA